MCACSWALMASVILTCSTFKSKSSLVSFSRLLKVAHGSAVVYAHAQYLDS